MISSTEIILFLIKLFRKKFMAKQAGAKKIEKGKVTQKAKKAGKKLGALYELAGESFKRKNRFCPKCGPGMYLGKHKDRDVCGKCGYVEMNRK
ncbi:MAG TPA: 30S ribosomal protein S27ae [Candidatus Nanoarchaeia archaeon]|nr:30S ribosomal protein S27ae [Candidatus Nanoarchaeia archaeon]